MSMILVLILSLSTFGPSSLAAEVESSLNEGQKERFLFQTKTVTNLVITTITTTSASQGFCYTVVSGLIPVFSTGTFSSGDYLAGNTIQINSASACRRRRWVFEHAIDGSLDGIVAASGVNIEQHVTEAEKLERAQEVDIESSHEVDEKNPRFGLSLIHTVTQTLTAVSKVIPTTHIKQITLTCTPLNLGIDACHHP